MRDSNQLGAKSADGNSSMNAAVPGGGAGWTEYQDPLEQAFTLQVPQGWTVKGGMFRMGYSDHREMVDMKSPDGKVNIRLGDFTIPTYFLPNQFHHEGEVYDLGAQAQGTVARYRSGAEFAAKYGKGRFARLCQSLTMQASTLPPILKLSSPAEASQASQGDATFACGDKTAYVFAQTALMSGLWQVPSLVSYIVPAGQVNMVRDIVLHSSKSFQLSPAWIQKQNEMDREGFAYQQWRQQKRREALSAQVQQFEATMQGMRNQVASFERGQAQRQSQFQQMDNVISGITPSVDPYGNVVNAYNGPKSREWINPATGEQRSSDLSPGPGWQPLTPIK
jgi:hypothetical protein